MAYVMFQYDRPTDTRRWHEYNGRVRAWIDQLLAVPGALSFMAYRSVDGASPNTPRCSNSAPWKRLAAGPHPSRSGPFSAT